MNNDILKEVELVGIETFSTDDGNEMAKISVLEDFVNRGTGGTNKFYGKQIGVEYTQSLASVLPYVNALPAKVTLVKGLVRNQKNRDEVKLITIQDGWRSKDGLANAVDKIANSSK